MRRLSRLLIRLSYVFIAVMAALFWAGNGPPECSAPKGVSPVAFPEAPAALIQSLKDEVGDIARPDEKFDATAAVNIGRNRRLAFIWNEGRRWVVATELGSDIYSNPIFAYDLTPGGQRATPVEQRIALPDKLCATASELIAARP